MTTPTANLLTYFRMMAPADLFGLQKNTVGSVFLSPADAPAPPKEAVRKIIEAVYAPPGNGSLSVERTLAKLENALKDVKDEEALKSLFANLRFYGAIKGDTKHLNTDKIDWHTKGSDFSSGNTTPVLFKLNQLLLMADKSDPTIKPQGATSLQDLFKELPGAAIVLSDGNFIHPQRHSVELAELFMNSIPPVVMQRCVPYVSAQFVFDGANFDDKGKLRFNRPGLLRFLMGGATEATSNVEKVMLQGNSYPHPKNETNKVKLTNTVMGMEAFTSPQTLVNPSAVADRNRLVTVQDPFRPLATLESLNINVRSTIGFMSYKTADLTMKLHDRSRMAEIADFVRPGYYPRTTVWLTYGWRHPVEPGNPYADFINNNLLVREAYGVKNASYSFDNVGQVQINLQLYTRGTQELIELRFNEIGKYLSDAQTAVENIRKLRRELRLDAPEGLAKDIKAWQVINAGSEGSTISTDSKVGAQITELNKALNEGGYDQKKADDLIKALNQLYGPGPDSLLNKLDNSNAFTRFADRWRTGPDPFLMTTEQNEARKSQLGKKNGSSYAKGEGGNVIDSALKVPQRPKPTPNGKNQTLVTTGARYASFGKVMSSVVLSAVLQAQAVDEVFVYYYRVNSHAGKAGGTNLAEFPIDVNRLRDDLNKHIERNRTDRMSLMQFLTILTRSQVEDIRSPAYGFTDYYEPYDPKKPEPKLRGTGKQSKGSPGKDKLARVRAVQKPVIKMLVETLSEVNDNQADLLDAFSRRAEADLAGGGFGASATTGVKRIMRVHFWDAALDTTPHATAILGAQDDEKSKLFREIIPGLGGGLTKDGQVQDDVLKVLGISADEVRKKFPDGLAVEIIGPDGGGTRTFEDIKRLVSRTVPTIIVGGAASNVTSAQLASKTDDLTSVIMMKGASAGRGKPMQPNGGGVGNLPLRIFPATMNMTSLGCPLLRYGQKWFIDFNTGTTADTFYLLTTLTHTFSPGRFETQSTFSYADAYGKYEDPASLIQQLGLTKPPKNAAGK